MDSRWTALGVLTFARLALGFQFQSIGAVGPLLMSDLVLDNAQLGTLIGLSSLPGVLLALPGGMLGQRYGDRRVVLVGLVLMAVGNAGIGLADGFAGAALGRLVSATGAVLLNVLLTKMTADWFQGRELTFALGTLTNAYPLGIGLAAFVLPPIAGWHGLVGVFAAGGLVAVLGLLAIVLLYREPPPVESAGQNAKLFDLSGRELVDVGAAALSWSLYNVAYALLMGFTPVLLVGSGMALQTVGFFFGLLSVLFVVSVQAGGILPQWLGRPTMVAILGLLGFAAVSLTLPVLPSGWWLLATGCLGGLPAATLVAQPAFLLRPANRGPGMGYFYTWFYLGMALLPPLAGWLQDRLGESGTALYFAGAMCLLALVPFSYVKFAQARIRLRPK